MTFSLDTLHMQSVASSRARREGLHTAGRMRRPKRPDTRIICWHCCNITCRGENPVQQRLVRIFCWLGLLYGALLVGLHVLAVPTAADSTSNPLLAAFDEVLQRVVSLRQLQPKGAIKRAVRTRQQIRTAVLALAQDAVSPAEWGAERDRER